MPKTEADSLGEEQLGKLGEEEEEPATEQRREYLGLGVDLGEREEQVPCHASALALAMTDEALREAVMFKPGDLYYFCERQQRPCVFH